MIVDVAGRRDRPGGFGGSGARRLMDRAQQPVEALGIQRKLTTVLCADVASYSRLMGQDEERTLRTLQGHRAIVDRLVGQHRGRLFGSAGDSVIAEFASAVDAVQCAAAVQQAIEARNKELPDGGGRMLFRIGLNLGDVMVEGENLFGDGVNVAARLESLAEPGGICLSGSAYDQVEGKLPFGYDSLGLQRLKNIVKPVRVYRLRTGTATPHRRPLRQKIRRVVVATILLLGGISTAGWLLYPDLIAPPMTPQIADPAPESVLAERTFIAVLPFANLSGDPGQEYFSDGLTEDVIVALGRFSGLAVVARDAVFQYKGRTPDPRHVGRELGVRYLLGGSVRRAGDRVGLVAQLTDADRGLHLWSERYEGRLEDVFALQEELTRNVVGSLAIKLHDLEEERAFAEPTANLAAYDYALRGWGLYSRRMRSANAEAREMFERAIDLDPEYTSAYVGLGWTEHRSATSGWTEFPARRLERAEALARKALELEGTHADAHALLGFVHLAHARHDRAADELRRAIELNPSDSHSYAGYGVVSMYSGDLDVAIASIETARRLNPDRPMSFSLAVAYYLKRQYEKAIEVLEQGLEPKSDYADQAALAAAYAQTGRAEDASRAVAATRRLWPYFEADAFLSQFQNQAHRAHIAEGLQKAGLE